MGLMVLLTKIKKQKKLKGGFVRAKIKAIIFDMDGVLVDAKEWHYESLNSALSHFGFSPISRKDHLEIYDGLPTKEKLKIHPDTMSLDEESLGNINKLKQEFLAKIIEDKCTPSLLHHRTLQELKKEGYELAVCSNAIRQSVEILLSKTGLLPYVDFFLSNQDVECPKPHPEIYLKAIKKLGVCSQSVLICEDNIKGITAAKESGSNVLEIGTIYDVTYENIKHTILKIEKGEAAQVSKTPVRTAKLSEMIGGWFVGNFSPSILTSEAFEVAVKNYKAGDYEEWHVHRVGTEITVIIDGQAEMDGKTLESGDIILLEPGHGTSFRALTDLKTVVVKTPSIANDKYFENDKGSHFASHGLPAANG